MHRGILLDKFRRLLKFSLSPYPYFPPLDRSGDSDCRAALGLLGGILPLLGGRFGLAGSSRRDPWTEGFVGLLLLGEATTATDMVPVNGASPPPSPVSPWLPILGKINHKSERELLQTKNSKKKILEIEARLNPLWQESRSDSRVNETIFLALDVPLQL